VYPDRLEIPTDEQVPIPAIANPGFGHKFSYSPSIEGDGQDTHDVPTKRFAGPRTSLALIGTHVSSGEIWNIAPRYANSSYTVSFFGPAVKCDEANNATSALIEQKRQEKGRTTVEGATLVDDAYYAFVPYLDAQNNLTALDSPIYQRPLRRSHNELWMVFSRYQVEADGFLRTKRHYQVCRLYNATYEIDLGWENGVQTTRGHAELREPVVYPIDPPGTASNMAQHAYSAFFWVLTDHLVGWLGYYQRTDCEQVPEELNCAKNFGIIASPIGRTALLGSDDLDVFFDFNENRDEKGFVDLEESDQRKQDKARARNGTLDVLIPELAFNMTASILFNPLFT
jgi:hypothetical protein